MITVFISGWFDVLHPAYVDWLERARDFGDRLIVGLYSDRSARALKAPPRPRVPQELRAATLRTLCCVDDVIIFDEPTPVHVIAALRPDVLIKSAYVSDEQVSGADIVWNRGGLVLSLPWQPGNSTPARLQHIQSQEEDGRHPEELVAVKGHVETPLMWVLRRRDDTTEQRAGDPLVTGARHPQISLLPAQRFTWTDLLA